MTSLLSKYTCLHFMCPPSPYDDLRMQLALRWHTSTQRWRERETDWTTNFFSKCFVFYLRSCPARCLYPCHPLSRDPSICYLATVSKATKLPSVCRPHLHISRPASLCSFVSAADCMDGEGTHSQKAQLLVCIRLTDSLKEITYEWNVKGVEWVGLIQQLGVASFLLLY